MMILFVRDRAHFCLFSVSLCCLTPPAGRVLQGAGGGGGAAPGPPPTFNEILQTCNAWPKRPGCVSSLTYEMS